MRPTVGQRRLRVSQHGSSRAPPALSPRRLSAAVSHDAQNSLGSPRLAHLAPCSNLVHLPPSTALPVTGKGQHTGRVLLRRDGAIPPLPSSFAPPFAGHDGESSIARCSGGCGNRGTDGSRGEQSKRASPKRCGARGACGEDVPGMVMPQSRCTVRCTAWPPRGSGFSVRTSSSYVGAVAQGRTVARFSAIHCSIPPLTLKTCS